MPYVIFSDQAGNFSGAAIQPTADVAAAWGVDSPEGMINELKVRNLRVVWDHFHGDRLGRTSTRRMRQADYLGPLLAAGLVDGVHIGLFRADFKAVDPDRYQLSVNEGQRLVHGESVDDLPLGDLFTQLHDSDWRGDVTIEAAPTGIAAVYGQLPISDVINLHHDMVDTVQGALSHMRWASFPATN